MRFSDVAPVPRLEPLLTGALLSGLVFCLVTTLVVAPRLTQAQSLPGTSTTGAAVSKPASGAARPASAASAALRASKSPTSPLWTELTPPQQQALAPLASAWLTISEAQKRKWLVISRSYGRLPPAEQAKLHSRMTDWVALSPQQRSQARLNFGATKRLSPDDKKAKWEAYQALPPEEKLKLAAGAASAPKSPVTAAAVKPVPPKKLATLPNDRDAKPPRIAAAPHQVDQNTLLPPLATPVRPATSH